MVNREDSRQYSKGYAAGLKAGASKVEKLNIAKRRSSDDARVIEAAALVILPFCFQQDGWRRGSEPIRSIEDRVKLAWEIGEAFVALRPKRVARVDVFLAPPAGT